jgi:hypothetical protein
VPLLPLYSLALHHNDVLSTRDAFIPHRQLVERITNNAVESNHGKIVLEYYCSCMIGTISYMCNRDVHSSVTGCLPGVARATSRRIYCDLCALVGRYWSNKRPE